MLAATKGKHGRDYQANSHPIKFNIYFCGADREVDKGPFLIKTPASDTTEEDESKDVFLKVGEPKHKGCDDRAIVVTENKDDAAQFYVKFVNTEYFEILHYNDDSNDGKTTKKKLYLCATKDDSRDDKRRSLQLLCDADASWHYMSLHDGQLKLAKDPTHWLQGKKSILH